MLIFRLCLYLSVAVSVLHAELRTFTNDQGNSIKAELVELADEDTVTIRFEDGRLMDAALTAFSQEDIEYIKEWWSKQQADEKPQAEAPAAPLEALPSQPGSESEPSVHLAGDAMRVLDNYCISCHGPDKQKSDIRFDLLETIDSVDRQELYLKMQDVIHFEEMPPEDSSQPDKSEREALLAWLDSMLDGDEAKKLEEKLRRPESGNYVDHEALFSGEHADKPGYTHDRRWLISEYIFNEKINRILKHNATRDIDGVRHQVQGSKGRWSTKITNPFLLSKDAGVRYYANETLNGGHLLTMLANAKEAADEMITLAERHKDYLTAIEAILDQQNKNQATLENRERFLELHIEYVLRDVFKNQHERMLPQFVRVEVPPLTPTDGSVKRPSWNNASPGREELLTIFRSMRRYTKPGISDSMLIEACEREWFFYGHDERAIKARVTFMLNYLDDWRAAIIEHKYDERNPVIEYKPLGEDEMDVIIAAVKKHRTAGDTYQDVIDKCIAEWKEDFEQARLAADPPSDEQLGELINQLFAAILERDPSEKEAEQYKWIANNYYASSKSRRGMIKKMIQTIMLNTDFVYRKEFGTGDMDDLGRRMLSPYDASYALAYALTDASPDPELAKAAAEGRLNTRADYEREVRRMLKKRDQYYIIDEAVDSSRIPNFTNMPIRELRFFREFFGYAKMLDIFKDDKRFGGPYEKLKTRVVAEADMVVEHVLEKDQNVIENLLTTDEFYVYHSGDNEAMQTGSDRIKKIYNYFKDKNWREFKIEDLRKHADFIEETQMRGIDANRLKKAEGRYNPLGSFMKQMESFEVRLSKGQKEAAPYPSFPSHGFNGAYNRYGGQHQAPEVARMYNIDMADWDYPTQQPVEIDKRKGILTHPAWLISFAGNTETDPIHRGIWVQKKLLAGTIPDVPITVDAVIPEDPHKTLRQRLDDKTNNDYCMRCHHKINPLGIPFEIYDDFGRYRTEERLEYPENLIEKIKDKGDPHEDLRDIYKTLPVDPRGYLEGTGNSQLDGNVSDALELIDRLAQSDRVRQSVIRHAFRYFMGRNETLNDSKTLIDAEQAYLKSGGSFDELIVSLLTSDSFIYRKPNIEKD